MDRSGPSAAQRRRRVAIFIDSPDPGGAETLVVQLARALPLHGIDPLIITTGNTWLEARCRRDSIPCRVAPDTHLYRSFWTLPLFALRLRRFLARRRIEVLHSHLTGAAFAGALACFGSKVRHVATLHDVYSLAGLKSRITLLLAVWLGTRVVVVSEQMRMCFQRSFGLLKRFITATRIWNGIPTIGDCTTPAREGRRAVTIINVARLVPLKGHFDLLEALSLLARQRSDYRVRIVGDGPLYDELRDRCRSLGLSGTVELLGHRDGVAELLRSSDVFVSASHTEGLSMSIGEAMAAGLPVVATDVGGNAELVESSVTGFLVPVGDVAGLAERLELLIESDVLRNRLGAAGRERIEAHFSERQMVERYVRLYSGGDVQGSVHRSRRKRPGDSPAGTRARSTPRPRASFRLRNR